MKAYFLIMTYYKKFLVMYSSFFLFNMDVLHLEKKINPNRVIKQYCIGGLLLILFNLHLF